MRILILSFYYAPDLCPGSFRCTALVKQLQALLNANDHLEIITTVPNRYASFSIQAPEHETYEHVSIRRILLPYHESGMFDQSKAFMHFAKKVRQMIKEKNYDLVFASSSRLMTAVLGAYVAQCRKATLYLDIRDIFSETLADILPNHVAWLTKPFFSFLEAWTFRKAQRINLISPGFKNYVSERYPHVPLSAYTNGIDEAFFDVQMNASSSASGTMTNLSSGVKTNLSSGIKTILYAGNIGEGQGLHRIIPLLAKRLEGHVQFQIIGDGGRRVKLLQDIENIGCNNVTWSPPIHRDLLIEAYQKADILFLHLNDYPAFKKVLPSKIFEYAAMGKPIWAGVAGYAAQFIRDEIENAMVFPPCDVQAAVDCLGLLALSHTPRKSFMERFKRQNIMAKMAQEILAQAAN